MPSCSIIQCGARKTPNRPHLTVHRFPKNEVLRRKWLEVIGMENIKAGLKVQLVCSLHFAESAFNKTLDVIRLRDDAVPTIHLVASNKKLRQESPVFCKTSNTQELDDPLQLSPQIVSTVHLEASNKKPRQDSPVFCETSESSVFCEDPLQLSPQIVNTVHIEASKYKRHQESPVFCETSNTQKSDDTLQLRPKILHRVHKEISQINDLLKIKALREKYVKQQKKIKNLTEMVRKKNIRIAKLEGIIQFMRRKNCTNMMIQDVLVQDEKQMTGPNGKLRSPNRNTYRYQRKHIEHSYASLRFI